MLASLYILATFHRVRCNIDGQVGEWSSFQAPLLNAHPRLTGPLLLRRSYSRAFRGYQSMVGIKHIPAMPFHPQTNGKLERYHQTLKLDVNQLPYELPSDLEAVIVAFVSCDNYRRYHMALGNVKPSDVLKGRRADIRRRRREVQARTIQRRRQPNRTLRELTSPLSDP